MKALHSLLNEGEGKHNTLLFLRHLAIAHVVSLRDVAHARRAEAALYLVLVEFYKCIILLC